MCNEQCNGVWNYTAEQCELKHSVRTLRISTVPTSSVISQIVKEFEYGDPGFAFLHAFAYIFFEE